jgi:predicted dehydrogenase
MKVLLIGLGSMGLNHLRILKLLVKKENILIYDKNKLILKKYLSEHSKTQTTNLEDLIKLADKIIIATSTNTHFQLIKKCLKFKKYKIFIEKPLVNKISHAKNLEIILKKNRSKIFVGLIERFNSSIVSLKKYVSNKRIFNIDINRSARVSKRNKDIDVISDLMIHDIDLAIQFNGAIKSIEATGLIDNKNIELAKVNLTHKNNSISSLTSSRITDKKIRNLDVLGRNFFISANLLESEFTVYKQTKYEQKSNTPYKISSKLEKIQSNPSEPLLMELDYFLNFFYKDNSSFSKTFSQSYNLNLLKICKKISKKVLKCGIKIN